MEFKGSKQRREEQEKKNRKKGSGKKRDNELLSLENIGWGIVISIFLSIVSFPFLSIAGPIIIFLIFGIIVLAYYSVFTYWGPRGIFFKAVNESTAIAKMKGGAFIEILLNFDGYYLDSAGFVKDHKPGQVEKKSIWGGYKWFGWPGIFNVWKYEFEWSSYVEGQIRHKKAWLKEIYLKSDMYAVELKKVEIGKSMAPIDIILLVTARVIHPQRAFFSVENWLERVMNKAQAPVLDFMGRQTDPEQLITQRRSLGDELLKSFKESGVWQSLIDDAGVCIESIETPDLDMEAIQKLVRRKYEEEKEAEATIVKAEADGKAKIIKSTADAEALIIDSNASAQAKIIQATADGEAYRKLTEEKATADADYTKRTSEAIIALGDQGMKIETLRAVKSTDKVIAVSALSDIADNLLGGKSGAKAEISPVDIQAILEALKKKQ